MREKIDVTGPGDHVLIEARKGEHVVVVRLLLTFSHPFNQAQRIEFKTEDGNLAGPVYVLDGEKISYYRGGNVDYEIKQGQSLILNLSAGLSAAGMVEYEISGKW